MITERRHALGDWELELSNVPANILNQLTVDEDHPRNIGTATLVITPARVDAGALGNTATATAHHPLFDLAIYTGVLVGVQKTRRTATLNGYGNAWHLGTHEDTGELWLGTDLGNLTRTPRHFLLDSDDWFDYLVNGGGQLSVDAVNVILRASRMFGIDLYSAPVANVPYFVTDPMTRREALYRICDYIDWVTYTTPQMVVRAGEQGDLWPNGPTAVVADDIQPDPAWWTISTPQIRWSESVDGFTNKLVSFDGTTPASFTDPVTPTGGYYGPDGDLQHIVSREDAQSGETSTDWETRADAVLPRRQTVRRSITLTGTAHEHGHRLIPGMPVYVYEPEIGLFDDTNEVHVAGKILHPVTVDLHTVRWKERKGMGVYLVYYDQSLTELATIDLSDVVVFDGDQSTTLEVGAPSVPL